MAATSLYNIVTMPTPNSNTYVLDESLKVLSSNLARAGIPTTTSNAISAIVGKNPNYHWGLASITKDPSATVFHESYKWDDEERYFFRYENKADPYGYGVVLEYLRTAPPFDLRGHIVKNGAVSEAKLTESRVKEAITAMLLAIMWAESTVEKITSKYSDFQDEYRANPRFQSGPQTAEISIKGIFRALVSNIDPQKESSADAFFNINKASLNAKNAKLGRTLEKSKIGYLVGDTGELRFASNSMVKKEEAFFTPEGKMPEFFTFLEPPLSFGNVKAKVGSLEPFMYPVNPAREYAEDEKNRLVEIPEWYVPVQKVVRFANNLSASNQFERPIRNILFRGPAGCGKTEGAKVIASMCGLPYGVVTGHADMEFFDLTSMPIPRTESPISTDAELLEYLLYAVRDKNMALPDMSLLSLFPEQAYAQITGQTKKDATESECVAALAAKLLSVCKADIEMFTGNSSKFKIVKSDFAVGMERGWLVELQEMNMLLKPGTLVGLNNVMEHGVLQLPTGEVIRRHPDTVIVYTQNVGYAGTVESNQSAYSRVELKCDLEPPTEEEMVKRIQMHVPQLDEVQIRTIAQTARQIRAVCRDEIASGSVGTREEIAWAKLTYLYGNILEAAEDTILPSCSEDEEDRSIVRECMMQTLNT